MDTRDRIRAYAAYGGAWNYLETELIREGFSESFAADFCSQCRYNLGAETAETALHAYDRWVITGSEEVAKAILRLRIL